MPPISNEPAAITEDTIVLPAWASPPPVPVQGAWTSWLVANRKRVVIPCLAVAIVGTLGAVLLTAVPSAATEKQTLSEVASNGGEIDTAMNDFLGASPIQPSTPDAMRAESDRRLAEYRQALSVVKGEESSLKGAQSTLATLGPLSLGNGSGSVLDRQVTVALNGLSHADQVLTASVDQEIVQRAIFETGLKEEQMLQAIKEQQYMVADRIDADADHDLLQAEWRERYSDIPPNMASLVGILRLLIDKTDLIAILTFQNEQLELPNARSEQAEDIQLYNQAASDAASAQDYAWDIAHYRAKMAGYDQALEQLRSFPSS